MVLLTKIKTNVDEYSKGKTWYWYIPAWLIGLYIFTKLLDYKLGEPSPFIIMVPSSFNFILHEMAHLFTGFLPSIFTAAAGSFSEILLGILLIGAAFRSYSYFASLFGFLWFMLAMASTGDYMSDARSQLLPLVSFGGDDAIHDWHFVFGELGLLQADTFIGGFTRFIGVLAGLVGLGIGAWIIYNIARINSHSKPDTDAATLAHNQAEAAGLKAAPVKHFEAIQQNSLYPEVAKGPLSDSSESANHNKT